MTPTTEVLARLYLDERKSMADIGRLYGVHKNQVRRWLLRAAIPARSISESTSIATKGKSKSDSHVEKLRVNAAKARAAITPESYERARAKQKGREVWNKGASWTPEERASHMAVRRTDEYRRKLSDAQKGEKSVHWKGGHEQRSPRGWEWRDLRKEVYRRDNWTCQDCGVKCSGAQSQPKETLRRIQCHHIVPRRLGGGDEMSNLITLCVGCHKRWELAIKE